MAIKKVSYVKTLILSNTSISLSTISHTL